MKILVTLPVMSSQTYELRFEKDIENNFIIITLSPVENIHSGKKKNISKHIITESDIEKIQRAKEILFSDLENPLPIKQLSRAVGINQTKLKVGFKEVYNNTVYGALFDHKMKKACEMLEGKEWNIAEIAEKIGYSHPGHFINAFKKKFGITPHKYRGLSDTNRHLLI